MAVESDKNTRSSAARELLAEAFDLLRAKQWQALAALAKRMPANWDDAWSDVADAVSFGLSQAGEFDHARTILERAYQLRPTHRRASALAYVHYAALLRHKIRKPRLEEPEQWRRGFERWIAEALRLRPDSLVDRYRLGVYYASIQTCKDTKAITAFRDVVRLFERLPEAERTPGSRHWKPYVRALYGAARSAYRLGRYGEARAWIFQCIRVDRERHHVKPVFKLFLAAKVLVAQQQWQHAERALLLACEAPHRGDRDFVYALLAEVALQQGRMDDAAAWVELYIAPQHRKPYVWRLLGDIEAARGNARRAIKLYKSALLKDRMGRHKTLVRLGRLEEAAGRLKDARRAYERAADFRRKRFLTEDPDALQALADLCERTGDLEAARKAYARMAKLPQLCEHAEKALERLAG